MGLPRLLRTTGPGFDRPAPKTILFALALFTLGAGAQSPDFDFGDGRHGSFTVPPGETTIQDLWSQVRLGTDATAYDPGSDAQVPALENLTISDGATLSVSGYVGNPLVSVDPADGGVLRLKVRGTLTIESGAAVDVTGRGYRGGTQEGDAPGRIGQQGDTWGSSGGISGEANRGGGGGGFGEINGANNPGAGGGGGHREAGVRGTTGSGTDTSGLGGMSFDAVATNLGQGFRDMYPFPRFGSGGGRGGQVDNFANVGALGGNGGGVIIIEAARIVNNGAIRADGGDGGSDLSGGGGGAGGSVWIQSLSAENGAVSVSGGTGGAGSVLGNDGGNGGPGILLWDARFELATDVDGEGSVGADPAGGLYDAGTDVTLTPMPAAGWAFDHWEGDLTGSDNPATITMDGDRSVTAFFVELASLAVSPTSREVGAAGGNATFDVTVSGATGDVNWTSAVTAGNDFATISSGATGMNDGAITVNLAANTEPEARTATVMVSSDDVGTDPVALTITQSAAVPTLAVTPASMTAGAEGGEVVVQVANGGPGTINWSAAVIAGGEFASISSGASGTDSGTFVVTFLPNTSALQRNAVISVSAPEAENSPVEVTIVQQAGVPLLQVNPSTQLIGSAAGSASLSVSNGGNGDLNWTAAVVEGGAFAAITEGTSGTNDGLITVTFSQNSGMDNRVARIRVESSDASNAPVEATITQTSQESVLLVTPETQRVGSGAGNASFQVQNVGTGSMTWTASVVDGANFIAISDGSAGTNDGIITISVQENTGTAERTGSIQVQAPGAANNPQLVTVVQSPRTPVLRVVPAEQFTGSGGGTVSITIENGGAGALNWTASLVTGAEFLTLTSAPNGSGDGTLQVTVAANDTEIERSGTIRIEAPGADGSPQIATINQLGCALLERPQNLSASDGVFPDSVELIWSETPGATEYEIFRSSSGNPETAELLGTSAEPRFSDTLAEPPDYELVNRGCFNPGEFIITNVIYFYYVKAINPCGTSELSEGTTGYRGLPVEETEAKSAGFAEVALPNTMSAEGVRIVNGEGQVAVRLVAGVAVDSVWAEVDGVGVASDALAWTPVNGSDSDGWVVITDLAEAPLETVFTVTVGAVSTTGDDVAAAPVDFYRFPDYVDVAADVKAAPYLPADEESARFLEGKGAVHEIAPRAAYPEATLVWIPVPESLRGSELVLYYFGESETGGAWYPANRVDGWLASPVLERSDDGAYVGAWVNHGGTVRLGVPPTPPTAPAAFGSGDAGTLIMLLLTGLLLIGAGWRQRFAR